MDRRIVRVRQNFEKVYFIRFLIPLRGGMDLLLRIFKINDTNIK